jgi:GNAT superfamily N-acetyltransferase
MADARMARVDEIPRLAQTLASAFNSDPIFMWLTPERNRLERLRRFFTRQLKDTFEHGGVVTSEDGNGAAIWLPPDKWKVPIPTLLKSTPTAMRAFGPRLPRLLGSLTTIEKKHPEDPPHWYLEFLGTRRDVQRKGVGSAVIGLMLDRCDEEGIPAYLEASSPENVPFYARNGFEEREEVHLKGAPNPVWLMMRQPR